MITVPAWLVISLISVPFLVFSDAFHSGFEIPKLFSAFLLGLVCLVFLMSRREIVLPARPAQWFLLASCGATLFAGLLSPVAVNSVLALAVLTSLAAVYVIVLNLDDRARSQLLLLLLFVALAEALLGLAQAMQLDTWLPGYLLYGRRPIFGTLGNEEFLATFLGTGFFIALYFYDLPSASRWERPLYLLAMAVLLGGLVLTQNKGGLLFIALILVWRWQPRPWLIVGISLIGLAALLVLFPESVRGRVLLWLAALVMFFSNLWNGLGPGQLENGYLDAVHTLFTNYPAFADFFAGNAAKVQDAHNLILNHAAELGIAGLVLAVIFFSHSLRVAMRAGNALGFALLWLLFKSLYTVVLGAITSALLLVILLAVVTPRPASVLSPIGHRRLTRVAGLLALPTFIAVWILVHDYYYQRGLRAMMAGQLQEAQARFETALQHHPQSADTWLALAQVHFQRHDLPRMEQALHHATALKKDINVLKISAHIYYDSGRYTEAEGLYRFLAAIYPGHLTTRTQLALIALQRADYTEARVQAQAVLAGRPMREVWSDSRNRTVARQILKQVENHN